MPRAGSNPVLSLFRTNKNILKKIKNPIKSTLSRIFFILLNEVSRFPPSRLHALNGDKKGLFAVDISANYRLLFAGFNNKHEQTLDTTKIVAVVFIDVEDYH